MKILAIETAGPTGGVALAEGGRLVAEECSITGRDQSRDLLALVEEIVRARSWAPADLELVAVGLGPGSHNGVRVAVTSAKSIAYALEIPLVGIDSMDARACNPADRTPPFAQDPGDLFAPVLDARRGKLIYALFGAPRTPGAPPRRVGPNQAVTPDELIHQIAGIPDRVHLFGEGVERYRKQFEALPGVTLGPLDAAIPLPAAVLRLALDAYCYESWDSRSGHTLAVGETIHTIRPIHLLQTEAEERAQSLEGRS